MLPLVLPPPTARAVAAWTRCQRAFLLRIVAGLSLSAASVLPASTAGAAEEVKVLQVLDGDTFQTEDNRRVRYLGLDAPEKGDALGEDATQANNRLVGGKTVRLETGSPRTDRDGRLLAYVFAGTNLVNAELIRKGWAYVRRPVAEKYRRRLLEAQAEARDAGRGLWAKVADKPVVVKEVHARPTAGGKEALNDEYLVLENRGERALLLTGWTVEDESHRRYLFPRFTLKAGTSVTLHTGLGKNTDEELFWGSRSPVWNDDGDTVFVRDSHGSLVTVHVY